MTTKRRPETIYHKDLGIPSHIESAIAKATKIAYRMTLVYGKHARRAAREDRYGVIDLPKSLRVSSCTAVEVGTDDQGNWTKVVFRTRYNETLDLVLVVNPDDFFVRTVWLNRADDLHSTLDESKYARP